MDLNEVVIKSPKLEKVNKTVRSQHVYFDFNPTYEGREQQYAGTYFATKFPAIEDRTIFISSIELKLRPFDTSLFDLQLFIYQVADKDTLMQVQTVDATQIDKHHKLKLYLSEQNIRLQPTAFYLGYGFKTKNIPQKYSYQMYCSSKGGEGGMFRFTSGGLKITSHPALPYIFPFKITYIKT